MKLKIATIEGKTYAEVQDGKPIFVHDDGKEVAFDAPTTVATITRLNGEAKGHREAKEAAEAKLKAFEGIEDGEAARKALETVKNIEEGKLIAAGKVEEIKAAAKKAAEEQVAATNKTHAEELAKIKGDHEKLTAQYHGEKIGSAFAGSKFVAERTILPGPAAQKVFGEHFKVEDGKLIAYDPAGNKIFSRSKPGDIADFDEALEVLIDQYPYKDNILKGLGAGSGAKPANGAGAGAKTMARGEFDKLDPASRSAKIREGYTLTE